MYAGDNKKYIKLCNFIQYIFSNFSLSPVLARAENLWNCHESMEWSYDDSPFTSDDSACTSTYTDSDTGAEEQDFSSLDNSLDLSANSRNNLDCAFLEITSDYSTTDVDNSISSTEDSSSYTYRSNINNTTFIISRPSCDKRVFRSRIPVRRRTIACAPTAPNTDNHNRKRKVPVIKSTKLVEARMKKLRTDGITKKNDKPLWKY